MYDTANFDVDIWGIQPCLPPTTCLSRHHNNVTENSAAPLGLMGIFFLSMDFNFIFLEKNIKELLCWQNQVQPRDVFLIPGTDRWKERANCKILP